MIPRLLQARLTQAAREYPIVAVIGPRQSGKTTLVQSIFPQKKYVSFENLDMREFAKNDPQRFLQQYPDGAILDEAQYVPEIFSYLQTFVDSKKTDGLFILTGSQNFLMLEKITQSLAGRVALRTLLPLSWAEIRGKKASPKTINQLMFQGGYPRLYEKQVQPADWLADYIQTYLERDVRLLKNVGDLSSFHRFLKMCAARAGQLLNLNSLADDCGVRHNTAKAWISVLEASFLVFQLVPHFKNFNKRLVKSPKLYFYDTGLVCHLLGITHAEQLATHAARGALFENWVISELKKRISNEGSHAELFFWQEHKKREIDCLVEYGGKLTPVEIKSGATVSEEYFCHLTYWNKLSGNSPDNAYVVYAGHESYGCTQAHVLSWSDIHKIPLQNPASLRAPGLDKGKGLLAKNFDAPLPKSLLKTFEK